MRKIMGGNLARLHEPRRHRRRVSTAARTRERATVPEIVASAVDRFGDRHRGRGGRGSDSATGSSPTARGGSAPPSSPSGSSRGTVSPSGRSTPPSGSWPSSACPPPVPCSYP